MKTLLASLLVSGAILIAPYTASGANNCPPYRKELIAATYKAAQIHQDILDGNYAQTMKNGSVHMYSMDAAGEEEWHRYWQQIHTQTAQALVQATQGCN